MNNIDNFMDENFCFSNFYPREITDPTTGKVYANTEVLFQASKATTEEDHEKVRSCTNPGHAKRLGRAIDCVDNWDDIKEDVMRKALRLKFTQHEDLKQRLLDTGDAILTEGNYWHDTYWGVEFDTGKGKNRLGILLMELREEIKNE